MDSISRKSQSDVKRSNLKLVLNTIIKHEPLSRMDVVRRTSISKPTVSNLIEELLRRKLVVEIGRGRSSGGRRPILLKLHNTRKYFLAIDLGREDFTLALADLKGSIIAKHNETFDRTKNLRNRLSEIRSKIEHLLTQSNLKHQDLLRVICIAAGVYVEKERELKWFPDNAQYENLDIKNYFEQELQTPVAINHSTKLSLLGEKVSGKAKKYQNVIYIDLAYGLGCSLLINGSIYFGPNNAAGEIAYCYTSLEEFQVEQIAPYAFGALEKTISGYALQNKGLSAIRAGRGKRLLDLAGGDPQRVTGRIVFQASIQGDPTARNILTTSFRSFNLALANIINLINPEIVIFGGGLSLAEDYLLDLIVPEIAGKVLFMPRLEISELKKDAGIIGGIHWLIEQTDYLEIG
ncbi:MAG TPA: ROK family transcriptional regulator [Atribacteraceae bacterium]|nr:ROK family transcriptional regulator [Atribacteraceae bacterium]